MNDKLIMTKKEFEYHMSKSFNLGVHALYDSLQEMVNYSDVKEKEAGKAWKNEMLISNKKGE